MTFFPTFDERRLLVIDVDGILLNGQPPGQEALNAALRAVRDTLILTYVSGRSPSEQLQTINENKLLMPDYIVSDVGTQIHRMPGERPLDEWERYIDVDFDRDEIVAFMAQNFPHFELQAEERQTPLKVSYLAPALSAEEQDALQRALLNAELAARVVYS